ncbi:MAG: hypothetical protein LUI87_01860 [Lachnospiraceae bacterium]|nr:hypothetical protein [Lachnospiraceae bacterium]
MKKKRVVLLMGIMLSASVLMASAEEAGTEQSTLETETEAGAAEESWMDYSITIDGETYELPMMYAEFASYGWVLEETEDTLAPYRYSIYQCTKDDMTVTVYLLNLGINTVPVEDAILAGISIDRFYWDEVGAEVTLPCGITRGVSTLDDIVAAYGTPTDTYEGELYTQYTFEQDYNQEVELEVYKESGVLEEIRVENFIEPEDFDPGEVSTEVPSDILAYTKPDTLGSDVTAYEIEVDGEAYTLPVPVSVLLEDGWKLDEDSDTEIAAQYYGWVTLYKNNQFFSTTVVNEEDYATTPENCWLESLTVGGYTLDMDGALPGGVAIGTDEEAFLTILEDAGVSYESSESGNFRYYTYNAPSYGSSCEATVYIGTDSIFEKDTIIEVSCEHSFD